MILYCASAFIFIYVLFSMHLLTIHHKAFKALLILFILAVSQKYVVYTYLGGAFFAPQLPRQLLLAYETLYAALVLIFLFCVLKDLLTFFLLMTRGLFIGLYLPNANHWLRLPFCALMVAVAGYGVNEAQQIPDIKTVELQLPKLPKSFDGLTIAQITDTHIGPLLDKQWLSAVIEKTNSLTPDLILLTGDYIDGPITTLKDEVSDFARLRARIGIFGVTGNHEYIWHEAQWTEQMQKFSVQMLHNEARILSIGNEHIIIGGMPDLSEMQLGGVGPMIKDTMRNTPQGLRILIEHQPRNAKEYAPYADLMLSGHTHGGLMIFLQPLLSIFNDGFIKGLYDVDGMQLYVSPGTGLWNGFACRLGVPPEITYFILHAQ